MLLAGKTVLITGASRGIGRGTAIECARHGADVALNDATAGNWIAPDPNATYVATGTGITVTGTSVAVATANAGGTMFALNDYSRRGRLAIVVTTAGYFRCYVHGKQA